MTKRDSTQLSTRQQQAIVALLEQPTIKAAAKAVGVSERNLHRWLGDPAFGSALAAAESEAVAQAARQMAGSTEATISKMHAALPWGILGILGLLGVALVALAFVVVARPAGQPWPPPQGAGGPPQIVTREVVYFPITPARPGLPAGVRGVMDDIAPFYSPNQQDPRGPAAVAVDSTQEANNRPRVIYL